MKFLLLLASIACVPAFAQPDMAWSDSGIHGPDYATLLKQMNQLKSRYPDLVTVIEYGHSVLGRPLRLVLVKKNGAFGARPRPTLVMSGSTHGDEYLNIEDRLPEALTERAADTTDNPVASFIERGGAFVFIPILNPDGYEARSRENAHGVDLNRDWDLPPAGFKGFKEIETRALGEELETLHGAPLHLDYRVTVDYHCCAGALLYPYGYTDTKIPVIDLNRHLMMANLALTHLNIDAGTTGEILGYHDVGTSKDYYYSHYGTVALTYEGRYNREKGLFPQHEAWWEDMIRSLSESLTPPLVRAHPARRKKHGRLAD